MAENFQNFYITKLREACDASATTIYVETIPTITEGTLVIEYANSTKHEIIHFTGRSGYSLTGCTRGYEGTTAQSHSAGVDVRQNVTAGMLDKITNRAITTENIADEAVTTDKIADEAVTSEKIDFTTLGFKYSTPADQYIPDSASTLGSVTISVDGLYLIGFSACMDKQNDSNHGCDFDVNTTNHGVVATAANWYGNSYDLTTSGFGFSQLSAGEKVSFRGRSDSGSFFYGKNMKMFVLRVG